MRRRTQRADEGPCRGDGRRRWIRRGGMHDVIALDRVPVSGADVVLQADLACRLRVRGRALGGG